MSTVNENMLQTALLIDNSNGRMKTVSGSIECPPASQQTALASPLPGLPVFRGQAPQPKLHAISFGTDYLKLLSQRIKGQIYCIHIARILEIGVKNDQCMPRCPLNLFVGADFCLVTGNKQKLILVI